MKDVLEFYEKALKPLGIVKMADYRKSTADIPGRFCTPPPGGEPSSD